MIIIRTPAASPAPTRYLLADEAAGKAVVFDAPDHTVAPLLDEAQRPRLGRRSACG